MADGLLLLRGAGGPVCPHRRPPTTSQGPPARAGTWTPRRVLHEAGFVGLLLLLYSAARLLADNDVGAAFGHAREVLRFEQWLHLLPEQRLQQVVLRSTGVVKALNVHYSTAHYLVTFGMLAWLLVRRPTYYLWARRALIGATTAALVVYLLIPVAPPRMLAAVGFVDTARIYGPSVYGPPGSEHSVTNQYAAMPSMHVGWALLIAVVGIAATSTRWRWLWLLHPCLTFFVVVSTGNHYWVDGVVGSVLVVVALVATRRLPERRLARRAARAARRRDASGAGAPTGCEPVRTGQGSDLTGRAVPAAAAAAEGAPCPGSSPDSRPD